MKVFIKKENLVFEGTPEELIKNLTNWGLVKASLEGIDDREGVNDAILKEAVKQYMKTVVTQAVRSIDLNLRKNRKKKNKNDISDEFVIVLEDFDGTEVKFTR